jgi:prevent-host-death family protein
VRTLDSNAARLHWRNLLDATHAGEHTVITRYGKPEAAVIPFADYEAILPKLEELRTARMVESMRARGLLSGDD